MDDGKNIFMKRALQLARLGEGNTSPNPMVGAVIVSADGRIIGEGYHRRCGEGHAEVNAVASVADKSLLPASTIYVTLEPCSHYGKTPPCAKLLTDNGIGRVVVGSLDPNEKVSGRGVGMLRDAGIEVEVLDGEISRACRDLNKRFMTAHTLRRPFITLKWAQSADGFMDHKRRQGEGAYRFSTPLSTLMVHRLRSLHDAILTGSGTVIADNPRLDVRGWHGRNPLKIVLDRSGRVPPSAAVFNGGNTLYITDSQPLDELMASLFARGVTSVLVEAGPTLLKAFLDANLWDEARVEIAPVNLGENGAMPAPQLPTAPVTETHIDQNTILTFSNRD